MEDPHTKFYHKHSYFVAKERFFMRMKEIKNLIIIVIIGLTLACSSTSWATLTDGVVGYWSFDDQANPGRDDSGNGNDGTVYGAIWTTGAVGGALYFDGVNDYVDLGSTLTDGQLLSHLTIEAWVFPNSRPEEGDWEDIFYSGGSGGDGEFALTWDSSQTFGFAIKMTDENWYGVTTLPIQLTLGQWYHIAGIYSSSDDYIEIYLNGILQNTTTIPSEEELFVPPSGWPDYLPTIGGYRSNGALSWPFDGIVDEVRIYDYVVPEPATLLLLGLGGLLLSKRRG